MVIIRLITLFLACGFVWGLIYISKHTDDATFYKIAGVLFVLLTAWHFRNGLGTKQGPRVIPPSDTTERVVPPE